MNTKVIDRKQLLIPPEPTYENPYIQLDWIWDRFLRRFSNPKTSSAYKSTLTAYKKILRAGLGFDKRLEIDPRFYLSVHWDHFAVYNAQIGWRDNGYKSISIRNHLNVLRRVIDFAAQDDLTNGKEFIQPKHIRIRKETRANNAYSDAEIEIIRKIVTRESNYAIKVARPYQRTGVGQDPRSAKRRRPDGGWACWDNMVWFFENVLNCDASLISASYNKSYKTSDDGAKFSVTAAPHHGGVEAVRRRLGVARFVGIDVISPLVVRLFMETGLNVKSIFTLERDCYQASHKQTGLPYLRYRKERSKGDKELHLTLLDNDRIPDQKSLSSGHIEEEAVLHLMPRQSDIVRRTIELLLKLTEPLTTHAREEDKNYLLLYQTLRNNGRGWANSSGKVIKCANGRVVNRWFKKSLNESRKKGEEIAIINFNLSRFRATKITQMVREGHDFFRVQAVAGHASAVTTAQYLDNHQIVPQMHQEITAVLVQIHRNRREYENSTLPYAQNSTKTSIEDNRSGVIYKGIISDCKNVYDPPETVEALPTYQLGQACTYWNMCLFCDNIIITRKHLPLIIKYANDILAAFREGSLDRLPNVSHYRKALKVITKYLTEISPEDLAWAKEEADCQELFFDSVLYRGFKSE